MAAHPVEAGDRPTDAGERPYQAKQPQQPEGAQPSDRRDEADDVDPVAADIRLARLGCPQPREELDGEDPGDHPLEHEDRRLELRAWHEGDERERDEEHGERGEGELPRDLVAGDEVAVAHSDGGSRSL